MLNGAVLIPWYNALWKLLLKRAGNNFCVGILKFLIEQSKEFFAFSVKKMKKEKDDFKREMLQYSPVRRCITHFFCLGGNLGSPLKRERHNRN